MLGRLKGLDGLRGFAVTSVVLFHMGTPFAGGGFLGVDVFFVLSGFLITSLLLAEVESAGTIDVRGFYRRRARRLLPALLLLITALVVVVGLFVTDAAHSLRRDVVPTLGFGLNWWYIAQSHSYFADIARPPLLQHAWSLAIEEQFYLAWPLALLAVARCNSRVPIRRAVLAVSLPLAAASAMWMAVIAARSPDPTRAYFGTDTHAMGLLVGCALAAWWSPARHEGVMRVGRALQIGGGAAAVAITTAVVVWDDSSAAPYRGGFLVISLLTAVVIAAATQTQGPLTRLLEHRALRWLGDRSYGIYLWHWPIVTLLRPGVDVPWPTPLAQITRLLLILAIAHASYSYIEMPVRRGELGAIVERVRAWARTPSPRHAVATVLGAALLSASLVGLADARSPQAAGLAAVGGITAVDSDGSPSARETTSYYDYPYTVIFGDSVVLSGRVALEKALPDVAIDAAVSRQPKVIAKRIRKRRDALRLGNDIVIHMGTNGRIMERDLRPILESLRDRHRVVVVGVAVPRPWMAPSNRLIRTVIRDYPNVRLADWAAVSRGHRDYFVADGVHLTARGGTAFAAMVARALAEP